MSRAYTSKPVSTRASRGRGAQHNPARTSGRVPQRTNTMANPQENSLQQTEGVPGPSQTGAEARIQHRGSYSVIAPDENKRASIARQAQRGTEAYERHKKEQKVDYVSYHGTIGEGGGRPAVGQPQMGVPNRNMLPVAKKTQQQWREEARRGEDAKAEEHKTAQRQKAMHNAERDNARHRRLDEEKQKKEQKVDYVSYHGTVGEGGGRPAVGQPQMGVPNRNMRPVAKKTQQQWREEARRSEDAKAEEHKTAQRQKAMHNTERDSARHRRLDGDKRQANEAFLSRIERENRLKKIGK